MLMVACPTPGCGKKLMIPDELVGKMVRCSGCQAVIQTRAPAPVPLAQPVPTPVPTPAPATLPQMELDSTPPEVPQQRPAPHQVAPVEEDIPELSAADIVQEDEVLEVPLAEPEPAPRQGERRREREPERRPEPSGDPFAFNAGSGDAYDRPRRRAAISAAVGWLRAGAILHFLAVLLGPLFVVLSGIPLGHPAVAFGVCVGALPHLIQSVILGLGAQGLDRLKWQGMVITAVVFAFIGFVLCLLLLGLAFIALVVLLERNLPAFEGFFWFVRFLLLAGLALCNLMAGLKTVAALGNKTVREAYQARNRRAWAEVRREDAREDRRERDRDEDDDRPRRRRRDED